MDYVNIVLCVFLVELVVDFLLLKIFKIHHNFWYLLFLQVPKVCATIICLYFAHMFWVCLISKILSKLIFIIFVTDSFKLSRLFSLMFLELIILFSISGFVGFLLLCINSSIENIFMQKPSKNYTSLIIFLIFLYIFAFFKLVRIMENNKFFKKYLTKVSFFIDDKHINLYGLIDSGNSLIDPITRLPVVLVSEQSLKKYLSIFEIEDLISHRCRKIKCDTISGSGYEFPIFKVHRFVLRFGKETRKFRCMVGVIKHKFEKGKIDCLLHRDFL